MAIVKNTTGTPGRIPENAAQDSIILKATNEFLEIYTLIGDPVIATESLAASLVEENYFNEVLILDSVLQVKGVPKQTYLSKEVVNELTEILDVDMIIALEELQIQVQRQVHNIGQREYLGTVDAKVLPTINLYVPNRNSPLIMINGIDSIFWEDVETSKIAARTNIVPDEQLIAEASAFAGTIPVKYMVPTWRTVNRFLFINGSSQMRDAAHFVQINDWERALVLWEMFFETAKGNKKARAASNISLYYEMNDQFEQAREWGEKALELARASNRILVDESDPELFNDYMRIRYNQAHLSERIENYTKLNLQLERFGNDY